MSEMELGRNLFVRYVGTLLVRFVEFIRKKKKLLKKRKRKPLYVIKLIKEITP